MATVSFFFHGLNCVSLPLSTCPLPPHPTSYHWACMHLCFGFLLWPHGVLDWLGSTDSFFFTLHTRFISSVPSWLLCSFGMGPWMVHHFTLATIYKHFAIHNHRIHWAMCITRWQMQKHLYYSQSMFLFTILTSLFQCYKLANNSCLIFR
jgi:hypothetical protein